MHIYNSNHYSSTMKQIINDCLHSAKENPFAIHYVIVDDPKYYEEIFLKHTDTIMFIMQKAKKELVHIRLLLHPVWKLNRSK